MIYVYELPARLSNGFCFNGGNPVTFKNVDFWNYPEHPPIGVKPEDYVLPPRDEIRDWVLKKRYVDPSRSYLVLCPRDPAYTFVIPASQEPEKLPPARPNCPSCKGTGWMSVGNGTMHGCTDCYPQLMDSIDEAATATGSETAQVLNQDEIDSLLGFNDPNHARRVEQMRERLDKEFRKDTIIQYLRADKCDLKSDAAQLLERAVAALRKRPDDSEADLLVREIMRGRMYD